MTNYFVSVYDCKFRKYLWMRLKKVKISMELKKIDKSFVIKNKISLFPPEFEKVYTSFGLLSDATFANIFSTKVEKTWQINWFSFWCNFYKYRWIRLKIIKISLFSPGLKKVDKSFGSLSDATFANIVEWG